MLGIIFFGSLWGMLEATVGAALFKVMDSFILGVPLWERMILNPAIASSVYFYVLRAGPAQVSTQGDLLRFVAFHGGVSATLALPSCSAGALVGARRWTLPRFALPFLAAAF